MHSIIITMHTYMAACACIARCMHNGSRIDGSSTMQPCNMVACRLTRSTPHSLLSSSGYRVVLIGQQALWCATLNFMLVEPCASVVSMVLLCIASVPSLLGGMHVIWLT